MNGGITVNDGKGFFDSQGLLDTLIIDCNELPKVLMTGSYVGFCAKIVDMVQKLSCLKDGIKKDMDSLREQVDELSAISEEDEPAITEDEI